MGFSFKKAFSNVTNTITDIGTFGATALLRETKIAPKLASNVARVYGGTVVGGATGFVAGGVPGLYVGAAAGFGRGVSSAVHGESSRDIPGQAAVVGGITGGAVGAFTGSGVAGFIRNQVVKGAASVKGAFSGIGKTVGELALLKTILPNNLGLPSLPKPSGDFAALPAGAAVGSPAQAPAQYTSPPTQTLVTVSPTDTPSAAPAAVIAAEDNSMLWLFIVAALAIGYFVFVRKKHG